MRHRPRDPVARALAATARLATRRPWSTVLVGLVLTVTAIVFTINGVSVNADTEAMIDPSLEFRQTHAAFKQRFPQVDDTLVVVIEAEAPEAADLLQREIADRLRGAEGFRSVFAPGTQLYFRRNGLLFLAPEDLASLLDRLAEAQPFLARLAGDPATATLADIAREAVTAGEAGRSAPLGATETADRLLAAMARVIEARAAGRDARLSWRALLAEEPGTEPARRIVLVQPPLDPAAVNPGRGAIDLAAALAAAAVADLGLAATAGVRFTGTVALQAEELRSASRGAGTAGLLSLALVSLVAAFGLRSLRLAAALLATLVVGLSWTAALGLALYGAFNIISIAFAVLFIGLGIDFGIHLGLRYGEERRNGCDHPRAVRIANLRTGRVLLLCAPTTAAAFLAFAATDYVGLAQLGVISAIGMAVALAASLTVLPALLTIAGGRSRSAPRRGAVGDRFAAVPRRIARHAGAITVAAVLAGLAASPLALGVRFDPNPLSLKDPDAPSMATLDDLIAAGDATLYTAEAVAEDASTARRLADRLEALPTVREVVWLERFLPDAATDKRARIADATLFLTPVLLAQPGPPRVDPARDEAALAALASAAAKAGTASADRLAAAIAAFQAAGPSPADWAGLAGGLFAYWPAFLRDLQTSLEPAADATDPARLPAELVARYRSPDGAYRLEIRPAGDIGRDGTLEAFVAETAAVADVTGSAVQIVRAGDVVGRAMLVGTAIAAGTIAVLLAVALRRPRGLLLALYPVVLAAVFTLATMAVVGLPFNYANVIVLPLLIGLGVDAGIHFSLRHREERERTGAPARGTPGGLFGTSTPRAVLLSAVTTIASFGSLAISPHRGTASMGLLLSVAVGYVLLTTLVALPALIAWLDRRGGRAAVSSRRGT